MARPRIYADTSERVRAWKQRNPDKVREQARRTRAKRMAAGRSDDHLKIVAPGSYASITVEQLDALAVHQALRCAICGVETRLVIDHDHSTGLVRGLLCPPCNSGLGMFRDRTEALGAAIAYLVNPPARAVVAGSVPEGE